MKSFLRICSVCLIFSVIYSCKKDKRVLGSNIQPAADSLSSYFSTNKISAFTQRYDSVATYNSRYKFLGSNLDPVFGSSEFGIYLNANTSASNIDFQDTSVIISSEIILALDNTEITGNPADSLEFRIYTLDSSLYTTRVYYTNNKLFYNTANLVSYTTMPSLIQHTTAINTIPVIRIPVDTTFAGKLMRDKANLVDNPTFQSVYKGFYIEARRSSGHEGVIYRCDLEDPNSGFYLHYKYKHQVDTLNFAFNFSGTAAVKFNTTKFDVNSANLDLVRQYGGDSTASGNNLFLKGMGFSRVKIKIPDLINYSDSFKVAVNRAELIVNVDMSNFAPSSTYTVPPSLDLLYMDSANVEQLPPDITGSQSNARYNGFFDPTYNQYVFNIAVFVQSVLNGKRKNYGFYLVVADNNPTYASLRDNFVRRVVLGGVNNTAYKPTFSMSYVKFKKD